jgi:hypothetical protein
MTSIWYEVFPVTVVSKQAMLMRSQQDEQHAAWMIAEWAPVHPNTCVVQQLITFFDNAFDPEQMIVHSTSWRYEQESDRLILTYLAVLPQGLWVDQWITTGRIALDPIRATEVDYGDHLFPPKKIEPHQALAHALDHLASLCTYDQAIQLVLQPEWRAILCQRTPKPAGCFQRSVSLMLSSILAVLYND